MNYPNGQKKVHQTMINFSNRGMNLENMINLTNNYYIDNNIAYIYKKPTPIKIVSVDYPSRNKAVITKAFYSIPSTTDYNGIYNGYYIDFEAKETKSKTSFSLSNIHEHQIKHLINITNQKGIGFIIISFTLLNEIYLIEFNVLKEYITNNIVKSLHLNWIRENGYLIEEKYQPRLDYLKIVDILIQRRDKI